MDKLQTILKDIPADAPVFDLTGETVFFRNGYYFCCLPYGQYQEVLLFKIPDIGREMEKRNTKYVYTSSQNRLGVLPGDHADYVKENFENRFPDGSLMIKKK